MHRVRVSLLVPAAASACLAVPTLSYGTPPDVAPAECSSLGCLTLGIGVAGGADLAPGLGFHAGLSHSWGWRLVAVRGVGAWTATTVHPMSGPSSQSLRRVADVSVLGGAVTRRRWGSASVSAGVGAVWGRWDKRLADPCRVVPGRDFMTVGFPIEAQFFTTPLPGLGVGASWFLNLNRESSYSGFMVSFQFVATGVPRAAVLRDTT